MKANQFYRQWITDYRKEKNDISGEPIQDGDLLDWIAEKFETGEFKQLDKPVVMQAEGSDGVSGAAVGNSADGQSGSDGVMKWCDSCRKITKWIDGDCENYKTRGGSDKGALPR